jgi:hypothetical protein
VGEGLETHGRFAPLALFADFQRRVCDPPTMNNRGNPFKIGDRVVFDPDARTIGWTYSSFDRLRIYPGDVGIVTRIVDDMILMDDGRGGFAWECFKKAE